MMERAWTREVAGCSYYMALSSLIKKPSFDEAGLWGGVGALDHRGGLWIVKGTAQRIAPGRSER